MGRLDDMRAAAAKATKPNPPAPVVPPPSPAPAAKPKVIAVEADAKEIITFECGHKIGVHHFRCKKCDACAGNARRARNVKKREKAVALAMANPRPDPQRLPPGSVKTLTWNGSEWRGALAVPGAPEFTFAAPGEKGCYHGLHNAYMAWLNAQTGEKVSA